MKINLGGKYYLSKNGLRPILSDFKNTPEDYFKGERGTSLRDKVALVTGGYKGIGLAIVKSFLREGAEVIFTGRNSEQMKTVYDNLDKNNSVYMEWDVTDTAQCGSLMKKAFDIFGAVDILVNNAGIYESNWRKGFQETTSEDIVKMSRTNFIGIRTMCENYSNLTGNNGGRIINILSTCGLKAPAKPDWSYSISKWALVSYTKALAVALSNNIKVNGIAPGPVKTDMSWKSGQSIVELRSPNRRMSLPEEIAELALMLAGRTGDIISGRVFRSDGGFVLI
jgi:NAD(P)-dependent dehydrogenase (short-subunit alcohol dehydrogenase family)